jgi:hypothetical protein
MRSCFDSSRSASNTSARMRDPSCFISVSIITSVGLGHYNAALT